VNLAKGYRGGERQTSLLIRQIAKCAAEQYLLCRPDSPLLDELKDVPRVDFRPISGRLAGHFHMPPWTVAHAHESKAAHWTYIDWLRWRKPYIITRRNVFVPKSSFVTRGVYRHASRVVAVSGSVSDTLCAYEASIPVDIIKDASTGLSADAAAVAKLRESYGGRKIVGHVGALIDSHKGQTTLLQVARRLRQTRPDLVFVFAGTGKDEEQLKTLSNDLSNVIWLGFRDDIADVIASFDVFAFPSRFEALGSTLLDVMEIGVPIVASNVDGIPELIRHGETGLLVEPGIVDQMQAAIMRLLSDRALAKQLTRNAAAFCKQFSARKMAEKYVQIYQQICARA
jgi:glycosyltransferase involved in cell wall biosynthesis